GRSSEIDGLQRSARSTSDGNPAGPRPRPVSAISGSATKSQSRCRMILANSSLNIRALALGSAMLLSACSHDRLKSTDGPSPEPRGKTATNQGTTITVDRVTNGVLYYQWHLDTNAVPGTNR